MFAATPESEFNYSISSNEVTITRFLPTSTENSFPAASRDVEIPSTIAGYPVRHIASMAFYNYGLEVGDPGITSVIIADTVVTIGEGAFGGNSLQYLEFPNSITEIGSGAFAGNQLWQIRLPEGLVAISDHAFEGNMIENLTLPSSVTTIGRNAFAYNRRHYVTTHIRFLS